MHSGNHASVTLRHDDLTWAPTDEGTIVVLDLRTSKYLQLNGSGGHLWKRLSDGAAVDELVADLARTYGIAAENARSDVDSFLAGLRRLDLVVDCP